MHRRQFIQTSLTLPWAVQAGASPARDATWETLQEGWRVPDWFRDAKFGIWAHWSAQCVPEFGDWYGRQMYMEGNPFYQHHLSTYGHPADVGFMEMQHRWKAENWDPDYLIRRYKAAGARYFMALACHHDNLDTYDSQHHSWNSLRVGPKRDIIGTWERIARREGLRFGVSNHASHAWHWWQTAYGYDTQGPRRGERYDAFRLRREDGAGKWWEGLDPQELYTGPSMVPPTGIETPDAMRDWHDRTSGQWIEDIPPTNPLFAHKWLLRQQDLVEKYRPDMVYFDNYSLPFGALGRAALAHYHEAASRWHGSPDVVATAKKLGPAERGALVEDIERGFSSTLRADPWQTCTCIGDWHYNRGRFVNKSYVGAEKVIQRLVDVVSKNGSLLLSIPMRGDGTIDSEEEAILDGITAWMAVHGDSAIHGSRPWRIFGEGPTQLTDGMANEGQVSGFTETDVRFLTRGGALFAAFLAWPTAPAAIAAVGQRALGGARVERVTLLGGGDIAFAQDPDALRLRLPPAPAGGMVPMVRIEGRGIV